VSDNVNHPSHYTSHPSGVECIEIAEHMNFCLGNAFKYVFRRNLKDSAEADLRKARWYIDREIDRLDRTEQWCPYPEDPRYEVSSLGRVRKADAQSPRKLVPLKSGYLTFCTVEDGKQRCHYVHRAVASAFIGPPPPATVVAHFDGNRTNNRVENLRYAAQVENMADRYRHGTDYNGVRNPAAKLNPEDVSRIRSSRGTCSARKVAEQFGVQRATIQRIWNGESWRHEHVAGAPTPPIAELLANEPDPNVREIFGALWRAGLKGDAVEDLKKARWYLDREIARVREKQ